MSDDSGNAVSPGLAWDEYWRLTPEAAAHRAGGPQDEVLTRFWRAAFSRYAPAGSARRVLDFACGNGAVTAHAVQLAGTGGSAPVLYGFDGALTAVQAYRARFPAAQAVVCDAGQTPFGDGAFDVVASQFGLEYAGIAAVAEGARLVAPGGALALVMHLKNGAIHRECEANLRAMDRLRSSRILAIAKEVFRRGFAASRGQGSRAEFGRAEERFAAAVREVDAVLDESGEGVAGGTVYRLYADLAHMHARMGAYDAAEVAQWADRMDREADAYAARMSAMTAAAIDEAGLDQAAAQAASRGMTVRVRETMRAGPDGGEPAAWILVCERA